jgi:hypothetical protein
MKHIFRLPIRRASTIAVVALVAATITCRDNPTGLLAPGVAPPQAADPALSATALSAPITHTLLTSGHNTTNQDIYTTAAISPAPNTLVTVAVLGHNSSSAAPSPTISGGGMTAWTEVATITYDPLTLPLKRVTVFRAMSAAPGSGPLTITFSKAQSHAEWIVSQWGGVDLSGVNGSGAIVQWGSSAAEVVNGLTLALAPFGNVNNVAYGVFSVRSSVPAITPGAGFTEIAEHGSGESPPSALQAQWTQNDNTIDATWVSLRGAVLGFEIKAGEPATPPPPPPPVSAAQSTVTADPTSIQASSGSSTITVTVKDESGAPIGGATVVLSTSGDGNTLTQPSGPTDASGVATGTLSSSVAETKTVTATANGTAITQTATVEVTPPPPVSVSQSTVTADPASIPVSSGTSTITVTVKDESGALMSGVTVVLSATGDGNSLTQPAAPTNASGVATGTLSSTVEGTKTVSATANGTAISQTATVEVAPPPPPPTTHPVSHTLLASGNNTTNQKVYTTASISPAPNALVMVAVLGHNSSSAAPSPTLSGGGMSAWTEVATITFDALAKPLKRMTVFRAMSSSPGSGPITITFSKSLSNAQWIVSQWEGVDRSGVNGAGAVVQTGSSRADAVNGLALTLSPFADVNNVAYGVFGVRSSVSAVTPGAGFTEIAEHASGESPPSALQAEWASNDNMIDATWANLRGAVLGMEIKAGEHGGPSAPVVSVEVTPASADLLVGGTVQLTATALNAEGEPLPGRTATWATDAPSVATVSTTGLVKGEGAGSATITATIEGKSGTSSVTVTVNTVPVASVEVTPATTSVAVGGTVQLTATAKDAAGQPLTGRAFTWSSDAQSIATVSASGLVTGHAEGPATITATSEGKSGTSRVTVTSGGQLAQTGSWSSVLSAPMVLVHTHLLLDGRVLMFGKEGIPQVWNPATGQFTAVPSPALVFCAGHDWLPDGRLLVVGGHISPSRGLAVTNIFDPVTASWEVVQPMAQGRWYPSTTTLPNGEVVAIAGEDANGNAVPIPEVWNGTSWRRLTGASLSLTNYPRTFVAPDGRIFVAGSSRQSRFLDVTGTGSWTDGPQRLYGLRSYGAAVMYEPGKIMYVGGGSGSTLPTNTAEIIDLNQASPQWAWTGSLATARWNHNATLLPTGEVLVTGGVAGDRSNPALRVNTTEIWDPGTGSWRTAASSASMLRGYHSSSLLLPDGRVLHGGGGDGASTPENLNYEVYSPPYLFRGARPVVTGATPNAVAYGQQLFVETPDGASITKVTLIRFGSVTHAFDWASRLVPLSFSQVTGGINVTIPASRTAAPPGPYMLFLVNGNGVPSVGRVMLLR